MRGKAPIWYNRGVKTRITPAYAGKSQCFNNLCTFIQDHPRLCGEKCSESRWTFCTSGSPPPMRGKVDIQTEDGTPDRITPAYAGKSFGCTMLLEIGGDHPRLCGEKLMLIYSMIRGLGSPPPMRGKAGHSGRFESRPWDHPRLCGEKTKKIPKQRYFFHQPASFSFSLQYT